MSEPEKDVEKKSRSSSSRAISGLPPEFGEAINDLILSVATEESDSVKQSDVYKSAQKLIRVLKQIRFSVEQNKK